MGGWFFIVILIFIVARVMGAKAKQDEAKRKQEAARRAAGGSAQPDPRFPPYGQPMQPRVAPTVQPIQPVYQQYNQEDTLGEGHSDWNREDPYAAAREREEAKRAAEERQRAQARQETEQAKRRRESLSRRRPDTPRVSGTTLAEAQGSRLEAPQGRRHTLESSLLTGHAHTESSIDGVYEECPPELAVAVDTTAVGEAQAISNGNSLGQLLQNKNALAQGIVLYEILGKPKALRAR